MSGKTYRLNRIFNQKSGNTLSLGIDHGLDMGHIQGLEDVVGLVESYQDFDVDGYLMSLGYFRQTHPLFSYRNAPVRIMTMDVYYSDRNVLAGTQLVTIEDAVREGADGVKVLMPWYASPAHKKQVVDRIAQIINEATQWEMPVMVEPLMLEEGWSREELLQEEANACRIAVELGADILKIENPGDNEVLEKWVNQFRVPVVILGGGLTGSSEELLSGVRDIMQTGIRGIVFGRNIFQREAEEAKYLLKELSTIIHGGRRDHA